MGGEERKEMLVDEMQYRDLPPYCIDAAKLIGLRAFMELCARYGGTSFYVPKFDSVIAKARDRLIIKEFTGENYKELALRYNLSEVWIRNIINKDQMEKNQMDLFGESRDAV